MSDQIFYWCGVVILVSVSGGIAFFSVAVSLEWLNDMIWPATVRFYSNTKAFLVFRRIQRIRKYRGKL